MFWSRLFATKSLELLHAEMAGENRLRRVLGPVGLTSLGVGAIIGAGIFVMTGRVAALDAGPAILISFAVAGVACALAAFCYAEFASMAPVAGSAYTYAYATLGELFAWIIGWDLVLEYAMSAATVAASWSKYLNEFLYILFAWRVPDFLCHDPFSQPGAWFNLPAVLILALVTFVLVIGIRESAASNTALVLLKLAVVVFVIVVGWRFVDPANWTTIPIHERKLPEENMVPRVAEEYAQAEANLTAAARKWVDYFEKSKVAEIDVRLAAGHHKTLKPQADQDERVKKITSQALAVFRLGRVPGDGVANAGVPGKHGRDLPQTEEDKAIVAAVLAEVKKKAPAQARDRWGLLGLLGLERSLTELDDSVRSPFMPYGLSGLMLGAALVFFAFIGFDSISTHSEEAIKPQRDVPIGILASLFLCTILYIAVAAIITGMEPYPEIDTEAAVASAFRRRSEGEGGLLHAAAGLIAAGALAGMTSVLLITFLSQARIFLAMARDQLLPPRVFGAVHVRFRTPHVSTMVTGTLMCVVAAFTPIEALEEMVNIGTLFAFVIVCAAVLILRIKRPEAPRPFRCPLVYVVAPLGIAVNLLLMLFLPLDTWIRLVVWLLAGLVIYFGYGYRHSALGKRL